MRASLDLPLADVREGLSALGGQLHGYQPLRVTLASPGPWCPEPDVAALGQFGSFDLSRLTPGSNAVKPPSEASRPHPIHSVDSTSCASRVRVTVSIWSSAWAHCIPSLSSSPSDGHWARKSLQTKMIFLAPEGLWSIARGVSPWISEGIQPRRGDSVRSPAAPLGPGLSEKMRLFPRPRG